MQAFDLSTYLSRIGMPDVPSGADGLVALQAAQIRSIPFENVDALLGRDPAIGTEDTTRKILAQGRGGWCFELNTLFETALRSLGFDVERRLARVRMGAPTGGPRTHVALICTIDGVRWLADTGFGGPAPLTPVKVESETEQLAPNGVYVLHTDPASSERVLSLRNGLSDFALYGFDDAHVTDADIVASSYVCATWPQSPFPSHLMVNGYDGDTRIGIFDRNITFETEAGQEKAEISSSEMLDAILCDRLGLALDNATVNAVWQRIGEEEAAA